MLGVLEAEGGEGDCNGEETDSEEGLFRLVFESSPVRSLSSQPITRTCPTPTHYQLFDPA
jgi:hypothetical protein